MRDWLSHRVVSSPDVTALVRAEDGESWSYTDLDRLVSETAGRLVAHGIEEGDRLGVLTPPYVGTVGLVHAAMRIGATFVPLGEGLTDRELAERIEQAGLSALVCAEPTEDDAIGAIRVAETAESVSVFSVDEPGDETVTAVHGVDPEPVDPPEWSFSDHLCILFTSGTTGNPKPVPLTAGNVYSSAVASAFRLGVDGDDRWLVSLALHHMGGLAPVYRSALYGSTLVLREGFDPGGTADDIDTYDVTGVSLVPTMLKQMLDRRGTLSDTLRAVLLGGAPAPDELLERCRDYSIPVYPTYGMTESASQIATATPRQTKGRLGTVGRPLFGTDITVVDEDGSSLDPGETGEIVVDGPTITPGYIDHASRGHDRSEFGPYGLHTGDIGRFDEEGFLYVLNRLDDRIISGGENVEPGVVVDVLREFPAVENVAVVGLDDEMWGERVSALVAIGDLFRGEALTGGHDDGSKIDQGEGGDDERSDDERGDVERGDNESVGIESEGEEEQNGGTVGDVSDTDTDEDSDVDDGERSAAMTVSPVDDEQLISFARDRLAGFKIPKTLAYVDELPRTVSGTVDREAVQNILRERGYDPRNGPETELEMAGFQPADPTDHPEPESAENTDIESDSGEAEGGEDDDAGAEGDGDDDGERGSDGDDTGDGDVDEGESDTAEGESDTAEGEIDTNAAAGGDEIDTVEDNENSTDGDSSPDTAE